jgi:hypothetical protein
MKLTDIYFSDWIENWLRLYSFHPVVLVCTVSVKTLGSQLMAEIGDVRRFPRKQLLIAFDGVDAHPFQPVPSKQKTVVYQNEGLHRFVKHCFKSWAAYYKTQ